jgi:pimeloyl-ACP methyl ester carboxylesterase
VTERAPGPRRRLLLAGGLALGAAGALPPPPALPAGGRRSRWEGFDRHDFDQQGRAATIVVPAVAAPGRPWLWRAEFFGAFAMVDRALLARGWHLAFLDCRNTFGSPATMRRWDGFYERLTAPGETGYRLHPRPVLLGMSRGGLYSYAWAARRPEAVGLIYGDAPVCDVKSWPAGLGRGRGSPKDWLLFQRELGLDEAGARAWKGNPIDLLAPIARARIPVIHVVGDADDVVPWQENTAVLKQRYEALGGHVELIIKKGVGHHPHGLPDPTPIVDYIVRNRRA